MRSILFLPTLFHLTALLTFLPFIRANPTQDHRRSLHYNHFRHLPLNQRDAALPAGWSSLGCYTDSVAARTLTSATFTDTSNMTVENCVNFCNNRNFIYAGVEYAQECYCGNVISNGGTSATSSDCSFPCTGNAAEVCGAANRLNLYKSSATPPPPPIIAPNVGLWVSLGCYSDVPATRTLGVPTAVRGGASNNSIQSCTDACFSSGYPLAGAEYAAECYCSTAIANGGAPTPPGDCSMTCNGNSSEFCGGPNRLNVYNYTGTDLPPINPGGGGGGGGGGSPVFPVLSGLPTGWAYNACWVDNAHGRVFQNELPDNQNLTVESCVASCAGQNFTLAGLEFGVQCFCGNNLVEGAVTAPNSDCNMGCGGNKTEACGGPNRLSVYTSTGSVTAFPVPTVQTTNLPGSWQYSRCLAEPGAVRVFPYQIILSQNNTADNCLSLCSTFGYPAAGMEFGDECWCGDVADITANGGTTAAETDCSMACSGDPLHLCGGAQRLQLYLWNGNLHNWNTPANPGHYEYLIPGLVPPLLATVGINGKVSFLEKGGTSEYTNSSGAYELDLSLVPDFDHAWREMHVKTDVFCSGAIVLPDKAARILNVGGWSLTSTFGIRLYAPDGSPGVNGTNDWEEDPNTLHLQSGRWYPTALVLSNGSVLVMGGETGSNAPANPTLEILPTIPGGSTQIFLDWLARTDPNNLYPFLHILPSGLIFAGYYNEARLLDPVTFNTVKVLPNIPGSVTSFLAGRTYPMEGASVLLPQSAPYTDPITVLICGGSNFGIALDNCVHTQPESSNPTWIIERMPSKRVMSCMVALPDGTFMIMNGAQQGVAGFGLADFPNLSALLYDPSQPVYIPPYLSNGLTQPIVTVPNTDWVYGGNYQISVQLFHGQTSGMRVSLVAAVSSTHGNTMGGRTIFPAFSCSGNVCTVTAPPNAKISPPGWHQLFILDGPTPSHGVFVRIGGDPGKLGNWPLCLRNPHRSIANMFLVFSMEL
ncbi:galactose oxidase [Multifurca ochricompacta]|uniref:Galactose oxidase n=1 Tax=Multifurca ochricompacta TaxID=376703 RepID=A0AAD4QJ69_9AGAM|nr:galactose oxidase [Multifurca ochricompacta]